VLVDLLVFLHLNEVVLVLTLLFQQSQPWAVLAVVLHVQRLVQTLPKQHHRPRQMGVSVELVVLQDVVAAEVIQLDLQLHLQQVVQELHLASLEHRLHTVLVVQVEQLVGHQQTSQALEDQQTQVTVEAALQLKLQVVMLMAALVELD
jgi:hypothetical protein